MAQVNKSVLVGYSAPQMFELVDRVEDYPLFLPWCGGSEVIFRSDSRLLASIHIDYMHIKQKFSTENNNERTELIRMKLVDGPFRQLDGEWRFKPLNDEACKIEFSLHYEFSTKLIDSVLGSVFGYIANSFVEAFVQRAEQIYGVS